MANQSQTGPVAAQNLALDSAAPTVAAGKLGLGATTATTATAGAATLPANPLGFLVLNLGGTAVKVPYYSA
jgi:hypothetical protein